MTTINPLDICKDADYRHSIRDLQSLRMRLEIGSLEGHCKLTES